MVAASRRRARRSGPACHSPHPSYGNLRDRELRQLTRQPPTRTLGGVGGALAQHAEETLAAMAPEQAKLVREVFRQLVTADGTRAILTRNELEQLLGGDRLAEGALEALVHARLLVTFEDDNDEDRVEVVHEALLSSWPRLVKWQREDAESARLRDQLRAAARQWVERDRAKGTLWRGDALLEYRVWRSRYAGSLTATEEEFAQACVREDARGRRLRRALQIAAFAILTIGMIVVLQLNRSANDQRERADDQRERAEGFAAVSQQRLRDSYQEQGRQAWLAGDAIRAFVYLAEARDEGAENAALDFLIARASHALDDRLLALDAHDDLVYAVQFSPDGKWLATADNQTAKLWDAESGELLVTLDGHHDAIWMLQHSRDGSRLITASWDGTARVWDTKTGDSIFTHPSRAPGFLGWLYRERHSNRDGELRRLGHGMGCPYRFALAAGWPKIPVDSIAGHRAAMAST